MKLVGGKCRDDAITTYGIHTIRVAEITSITTYTIRVAEITSKTTYHSRGRNHKSATIRVAEITSGWPPE